MALIQSDTVGPEGAFVELDGAPHYRIAHSDRMAPFLMTLASDTDLWMFVTSTGGLTAGRVNPDGSLFPYDNVDRLYDAHHHTGPVTLIRMDAGGKRILWAPFSERAPEGVRLDRNLYKSVVGNRIVFEEINHDLGLAFRYAWSGCEEFGFVRTSRLARIDGGPVKVDVLDGLRNVLPFGAPLALYQQQSSLVDAYKRNECDSATGLAIFSLTAKIIDRAEAAEELRANVVWSRGLDRPQISVSDDALAAFRAGERAPATELRTGARGHYLACASVRLDRGAQATWHIVADAGRGPVEIVALRERLRRGIADDDVAHALERATRSLVKNVASADGLQCTAGATERAHHFANVLFNNMRGGVFAGGYAAPRSDIMEFMRGRQRAVAERHARMLEALPERTHVLDLVAAARATGDPDFERLALEYLPLSFGRRHGDPSRPWNRFSIRLRDPHGDPVLYYEGNWRDIFQNWEALAMSFPGYLPGMIAKFVNASTVDGFNPYRITRDGVDWEVVDPDDPWGYIGYWGDHQIIYLLRLMEALERFSPESLSALLDRPIFSYANVPYRLKSYEAMLADPHATVDFDASLDAAIGERVRAMGTDGKLVATGSGTVRHATLVEKLIVTALTRLSNFVPDGGIWMNTQRPEWNDANNALAGNGVSTVTLCYLRRYLSFLDRVLEARGAAPAALAPDVARWAREISAVLEAQRPAAGQGPLDARTRRTILDELGRSFARYRESAYRNASDETEPVPAAELRALCRAGLDHADHAIALNRRADGLYHAYHVLGARGADTLTIEPLYEMLEGQVAALSAGTLTPQQVHGVVESLFASRMYDPARKSFMLYPERELPAFLEKNAVPLERARAIPLLRDLIDAGDRSIVGVDATGIGRFDPDLAQAPQLATRLDGLAARDGWAKRVARDRAAVLELYEDVFHHRAFTGRSGTMYGYEGLGCIYWHMVAKLLLAIQENLFSAIRDGAPSDTIAALADACDRVRDGLGFRKSAAEYGAFPADPYSHTPADGGARQPGMTGQVKEEILTRLGELGVRVEEGAIRFKPVLLEPEAFLVEPAAFAYFDIHGERIEMEVPSGALAFTFCQVPVRYRSPAAHDAIRVTLRDGSVRECRGHVLDAETSRAIFARDGSVREIEVDVPAPGSARA